VKVYDFIQAAADEASFAMLTAYSRKKSLVDAPNCILCDELPVSLQ
jgi:hypothetical protein